MTAGGSVTESESTYGGFITSSFLLMTLTDDHIDGKIKCEVGTDNLPFTILNLYSHLVMIEITSPSLLQGSS